MARDDDGNSMTDQQLRDEVITLLLAGHEPTAVNLSWAWYLLAQHPEVEAKLHAELEAVLGGRAPCAGDVPKLAYTDRVLREVLRLYPPAWRIFRKTQEALEVGGYVLPAGSKMGMWQGGGERGARGVGGAGGVDAERGGGGAGGKMRAVTGFCLGGRPR